MAEGGVQERSGSPEGSLAVKAILIGATGAVGECLLGELVASKVTCFRFVQIRL
jgi:hypothetical protein